MKAAPLTGNSTTIRSHYQYPDLPILGAPSPTQLPAFAYVGTQLFLAARGVRAIRLEVCVW